MATIRYAVFCSALLVSAALAAPAVRAEPVTYTIGTKLSRVSFTIMHQGFIELIGTMRVAPGQFVFDQADWSKSSATVTMPTRSIDLGDAHWNEVLREDESWSRLFKEPAIKFRMTSMMATGPSTGTMRGELTMAGVHKMVDLDVKVNKIGVNDVSELPSVGFTATTSVKRSDFGLDAYEDLVGDQMGIKIQIEAMVGPDPDAGRDQSAPGIH